MIASVFIALCLNMVRNGLMAGIKILDSALAVNATDELEYPGLVGTLYDVYSVLSRTVEQVRRIYQFNTTGMSDSFFC